MRTHFIRTAAFTALLAAAVAGPAGAGDALTGTVVVVNQASDTVTLIDLATMEAYRHVAVVGGPHEAAVSPDGRRAMVTARAAAPCRTP